MVFLLIFLPALWLQGQSMTSGEIEEMLGLSFVLFPFGGIWFGLITWCAAQYDYRRVIRQGLCRRCGYDLRGTLRAGNPAAPSADLKRIPETWCDG